MDVNELIRISPKFHGEVLFKLSNDSLHFIDRTIKKEHLTLETGAGISTVLFAIKGSKHHCITPNKTEVEKIVKFCKYHQISTKNIKFHVSRSEDILPSLKLKEIDFVLIDGRHAFPTPFIDWYYTSLKMRTAGFLMIDDTALCTIRFLKDFLLKEGEWRLVENFPYRAAVFKKIAAGGENKNWLEQPFLAKSNLELVKDIFNKKIEEFKKFL